LATTLKLILQEIISGMIKELKEYYGHLFEDALLVEIEKVGIYKKIEGNYTIMEPGRYIKSMPLLIKGAIKILREDANGQELLLYFLERGDTCALTLNSCLGHKKSEIRAISEMDTELIMVPVDKMDEWTATFKSWRTFVFETYHIRLMEMLEAIDSLAFLKMDDRILKLLKDKAMVIKSEVINNTHHEIAQELHTSRVVVSRILKKLENMGKIKLQRNSIKLLEI